MITVWGRASSSNVQAVMWCIEELGLAYQRIDAGFTYGVIDTDAYLAMNPNNSIPTIQDRDNQPLWESGAILRYLAARYSNESFWPTNPEARATVDQWAEWSKINIALLFTSPIFWQVVRVPQQRQNSALIEQSVKQFESKLAIANEQLKKHPYIAGPNFTLADIQFAHVLFRYYDIAINRAPLDAVAEYYRRIVERKAYREHVAISYQELKNTK